MAISGDTVVVGATGEASNATGVNGDGSDNSADAAGAAYVFVRNGATWSQQAYLKANNSELGDSFGGSVAIAGNTVVVGADNEDSNATSVNGDGSDNSADAAGAAYVFTRNGTTWNQQAYLKANNSETTDFFGKSVAIAGDTVVIGANGEASNATGVNGDGSNNNASGAGAAYVFVRNGAIWSQQAYLKAHNSEDSDNFGMRVALSGDTVVVSTPYEDSNATGVNGDGSNNSASGAGAAYVFVRNGAIWSQQAYLKANNSQANDNFGWSVDLSGDTVVVGAPNEDSNATAVDGDSSNNSTSNAGAAYVFTRNGATWSQSAYLKAHNTEASDNFGRSVALSGSTVVVGAAGEDSNATGVDGDGSNNSASGAGAAYVFYTQTTPAQPQTPVYTEKWGSKGSDAGQFNMPAGTAVDASGNIYVVDAGNHRIQKFTANGGFLTQWGTKGSGNGQFDTPTGIAVDSSNNVYVADSNNHRIQKFTANGGFLAKWGTNGNGNGQFRYPTGVTVTSSGILFIADTGNHRIQLFTSSGAYITQWNTTSSRLTVTGQRNRQAISTSNTGSFSYPTGVAADSSNNVYIVNTGNSVVQKFDSNGNLLLEWGSNGSGDGQFSYPSSIAVDSTGNVYIADSNNSRLQQFDSNGNFLATLGAAGSGNGEFNKPGGLATDSNSNLYIVDVYNQRI